MGIYFCYLVFIVIFVIFITFSIMISFICVYSNYSDCSNILDYTINIICHLIIQFTLILNSLVISVFFCAFWFFGTYVDSVLLIISLFLSFILVWAFFVFISYLCHYFWLNLYFSILDL